MTDQARPRAAEPNAISVRGEVVQRLRVVLLSRPVLAIVTLALLIGLTEIVPPLRRFSPLQKEAAPRAERAETPPKLEIGEARIETETRARAELAQPEQTELPKARTGPIAGAVRADALPPIDVERPPVPISDPSGKALDGFFAALLRTERKQPHALTRIVHFGDSIVTSDYVTGTLRRKLQRAFGDGGHGFVLIANAWPGYFHNDVYRFASSGWLVSRIVGPLTEDGWYGLGGVSFRAPPGARARFGSAKSGRFGRAVSRFTFEYVEEPGAGRMALNLDGKPWATIDANAPEKRVARKTVETDDGEHELEVVTLSGMSRAFGVILERDVPGLVLDAIGIQSARIRFLDKQDDSHWAEELRARRPNLLVYEFGANESADGFAYSMADYNRTMQDVLRQGRQAVPEAGCLVIGAMDRAEKRGTLLVSMEVIPAIVKEQQRAAEATGCAFFDTYTAMGGVGSMSNWVLRGLGQADLTHPTGVGSEVLASWIYRALMQGYAAYRTGK